MPRYHLTPALTDAAPSSLLSSYTDGHSPATRAPETRESYPWNAASTYTSMQGWFYGTSAPAETPATPEGYMDFAIAPPKGGIDDPVLVEAWLLIVAALEGVAGHKVGLRVEHPAFAEPTPEEFMVHQIMKKDTSKVGGLVTTGKYAGMSRNKLRTRRINPRDVVESALLCRTHFRNFPEMLWWPALGSAFLQLNGDHTINRADPTVAGWLSHNRELLGAMADNCGLPHGRRVGIEAVYDIIITAHLLMTAAKTGDIVSLARNKNGEQSTRGREQLYAAERRAATIRNMTDVEYDVHRNACAALYESRLPASERPLVIATLNAKLHDLVTLPRGVPVPRTAAWQRSAARIEQIVAYQSQYHSGLAAERRVFFEMLLDKGVARDDAREKVMYYLPDTGEVRCGLDFTVVADSRGREPVDLDKYDAPRLPPPPPVELMLHPTDKAGAFTLADYLRTGWTKAQLVEHGYFVWR